ncbi:hypothetical protein DFJ74DRAFT_478317 [Hyaloraphidium curvatum]|nr:hypothetical protein DFJ74DRAFT_478317 [Hyaloraphidium curvatum]
MAGGSEGRNVRILFYGFGLMNQIALGLLLSLRPAGTCDIVGVVDRNASRKGRPVGEILLENPTVKDIVFRQTANGTAVATEVPEHVAKMVVRDPAEAADVIRETKPDVCFLATRAFIKEIEAELELLIEHGVDVMTIAEEALFPLESEVPEMAAALEAKAKEKGVRILGTGFNDSGWCVLAQTGASMMINMTKIVASISWDCRDYGSAVNQYVGVSLTPEAFQKEIVEPSLTAPSVDSPACYSIAAGLGLTPLKGSLRHETKPFLAKTRLYSEALKTWIEPGNVKGQEIQCILDTEEGVQVVCESLGYLFGEPGSDLEEAEEMKVSMWGGIPETMVIRSKDVKGRFLTCTPMVNRLPQLLAAKPGFVTPDMLPPPSYLAKGIPKIQKP